jgi:hypothetical protein
MLITGTGTPNPVVSPNAVTLGNNSLQLQVSTALLTAGVGLGIISSANDTLANIGTANANNANGGVNTATVAAGAASFNITGTNTTQGTQTTHNTAAINTTFFAVTVVATGVTTFYSSVSPPPNAVPDPTRTGVVMTQLTVTVALGSTTWTPTGAGNIVFSEQNVVPSAAGLAGTPTAADLAAAPIAIPVGGLLPTPIQFHCWTGTATNITPAPATGQGLIPSTPLAIDTVTVTAPPSAPTCVTPQAASVGGGQAVTITPSCTNNNPPFNLATSTVTVTVAATNGTAAVQAGGTILYTNNGNGQGTDTFSYTVANTVGTSNVVVVNITVLNNQCTVPTGASCQLKQVLIVPVAPSTMVMSQAGNQDFLNGTLGAGLTCGAPSPLTLNGQPQAACGSLSEVTVVNARGTDNGWSLTGQVTDFIDGTRGATNTCSPPAPQNIAQMPPNNHCIPGGNLGWFPAASIVDLAVPGDTAAVSPGAAVFPPGAQPRPAGLQTVPGLHDTAQSLCSSPANQSGGTFHCDAFLVLSVPASTAAALTPGYQATLTLTLT